MPALDDGPVDGVRLGQAYERLVEAVPDLEKVAGDIGWPVEQVDSIENYNGSPSRFHMLTMEQAMDLFCNDPGGFRVHALEAPADEPARRCPTIALERCSRHPS